MSIREERNTGQLAPVRDAARQDAGMDTPGASGEAIIVDDDPFTLTMLRSVVEGLGLRVVGAATTFAQGLSDARTHAPQVALIDLDLGEGPTGSDLAHALRRLLPEIGIVMLSTYLDPRLIGAIPDLPVGGIYLTKQEVADTEILEHALASAIATPRGGGVILRREERLANLTDGQVEVMRLVAAGFSNAEIARRLVIEEASVEKAIMRLIRQLDVKASHEENQRVMIAQAYFALSGTRSVRRA